MSRRNISIPDDLWAQIRKAAADEGAKLGRPMPASEWLRKVILDRLGRKS